MNDGFSYKTKRCPIRFDGEILTSEKGCPKLGEDNIAVVELATH